MEVAMARRLMTYMLAALLLPVLSCADGFPPEFPAPDFSVKDVFGGKEVAYSEHRGKPVLIYFFASW